MHSLPGAVATTSAPASSSAFGRDRGVMLPSPFIRRLDCSAAEFQKRWDDELLRHWSQPGMRWIFYGRWFTGRFGLRWRGGLEVGARHELRVLEKAQRIVICLAPADDSALTFTEIQKVLSSWTAVDDVACVPICGFPTGGFRPTSSTLQVPVELFKDSPSERILVHRGLSAEQQAPKTTGALPTGPR